MLQSQAGTGKKKKKKGEKGSTEANLVVAGGVSGTKAHSRQGPPGVVFKRP
jgi:hypothetical protein